MVWYQFIPSQSLNTLKPESDMVLYNTYQHARTADSGYDTSQARAEARRQKEEHPLYFLPVKASEKDGDVSKRCINLSPSKQE